MVRDRLADLRSQNDDNVAPDSVEVEIVPSNPDSAAMEVFFDKISKLKAVLDEMEKQIAQISIKHNEILSSVTKTKTRQYQNELKGIDNEVSQSANVIRKNLKEIENENKKYEEKSPNDPSNRIRKTQHASLSRKFMQVISKYNDLQATMRRKQRDVVKRQCQVVDPDIDDADVDKIIENESAEGIFTGKRLAEAMSALDDIKERHEEIIKLEQSLKMLHDMFIDMAILIEAQGEMIDRIELNVSTAADYVERGRKDIVKANSYNKKSRKIQLLIIFCICIGVGIILMLILIPLATLTKYLP